MLFIIVLVTSVISIIHSVLVDIASLVTVGVSVLGNSSVSGLLLDVVWVFVADLRGLVNA